MWSLQHLVVGIPSLPKRMAPLGDGFKLIWQFGTGTSSDLTRPVEVLPDSVSTANPSGFGHILKTTAPFCITEMDRPSITY